MIGYGRVYLSGSMSSPEYESNFLKIEKALRALGIDAYNPADVYWGTTEYASKPSEGMRENTSNLTSADSIFLQRGWRNSRGCIAEVLLGAMFGCYMAEIDTEALLERGELVLDTVDIDKQNMNTHIADLLIHQESEFRTIHRN